MVDVVAEFMLEPDVSYNAEIVVDLWNRHNHLVNRDLPDQHPISAITDLTETLSGIRENIGDLENLTTENKDSLVSAINEVDSHTDTNASNLSNHIADKNNPHEVTKSQVGLGNVDNTSDLDKPISTATQNAITTEENRAKGVENGLRIDLTTEVTTRQNADTVLQGQITTNANDIVNIEDKIPIEASSSNQLADKSYVDTVDNDLQSQIDAISASSDVTDIVGTYAELQAYDTSTLTNDDIIKVLQDESQGGATTYYRWVVSGSSGSFVLIGSEGPYYTKAEADELFDEKQDKITATNKLNSDLVDDTGQTNKFVTASEKSQISTNASNITALQSGKADKAATLAGYGITNAYTKTEVDSIATTKANVGLDNLNADGQMIIDSQNGTISNCILEIPQNIKLTLENNVLTLKSGSILTRTGSTYATETVSADLTYTFTSSLGTGRFIIFGNSGGLGTPRRTTNVYSGNSSQYPTTGLISTTVYFNTDDKLIYRPNNDFSAWNTWSVDYPLCIVDVVGGVASFAKDSNGNDMIFNGAGFIGHHAFVYPNVKALIPDGFNEDGSLNNADTIKTNLSIVELQNTTNSANKGCIGVSVNNSIGSRLSYFEVETESDMDALNAQGIYYITKENQGYSWSGGTGIKYPEYTKFIDYLYNGTTVTNFTIRQPVRLATTEMLDKVQGQVEQNTSNVALKQDVTTAVNYDNITNCITEIPQDIKLELNNGTLTLKAGSKVYIPNGAGVFDEVTIASDKTATSTSNGIRGVYINKSSGNLIVGSIIYTETCSGTTDTLFGTAWHTWYDTTNNIINRYGSDGTTFGGQYSFPLAIVTVSNGAVSSIDQVFNGFGFISSTIFALPGVKGLIPNGRNADGTLKNIEFENNAVRIMTPNASPFRRVLVLASNAFDTPNTPDFSYFSDENLNKRPYDSLVRYYCNCGYFEYDSTGKITSFTPKTPFHAVDYNDLEEKVDTKQADITTITGYDATETQVLKNINGTLTWVTES